MTPEQREKKNARQRRYVERHPERRRASQKAWRQKVGRDYWRRWRAEHPNETRSHWLKQRHGITLAEYEAMLAGQDGRCAICGRDDEVLRVDHDHATGEVRGLLCHNCNVALGHLGDDPERLDKARQYLLGQRLKDSMTGYQT